MGPEPRSKKPRQPGVSCETQAVLCLSGPWVVVFLPCPHRTSSIHVGKGSGVPGTASGNLLNCAAGQQWGRGRKTATATNRKTGSPPALDSLGNLMPSGPDSGLGCRLCTSHGSKVPSIPTARWQLLCSGTRTGQSPQTGRGEAVLPAGPAGPVDRPGYLTFHTGPHRPPPTSDAPLGGVSTSEGHPHGWGQQRPPRATPGVGFSLHSCLCLWWGRGDGNCSLATPMPVKAKAPSRQDLGSCLVPPAGTCPWTPSGGLTFPFQAATSGPGQPALPCPLCPRQGGRVLPPWWEGARKRGEVLALSRN